MTRSVSRLAGREYGEGAKELEPSPPLRGDPLTLAIIDGGWGSRRTLVYSSASTRSARQVRSVRSVRPSIYQTSARDVVLSPLSEGCVACPGDPRTRAYTWQLGPGGLYKQPLSCLCPDPHLQWNSLKRITSSCAPPFLQRRLHLSCGTTSHHVSGLMYASQTIPSDARISRMRPRFPFQL